MFGRRTRSGDRSSTSYAEDTDSDSDSDSIELEEDDGDRPSQERPQPNLEVPEKLGSLEAVQLVNFMCHDNFRIEFGPNVNFVVGRNGSGKSAIMTALVLAFGGRATVTSRGHSIHSFIKKGKEMARVIVQICNYNGQSEYSYKFNEYGESIIIERTLRATAGRPSKALKDSKKSLKPPAPTAVSNYALRNALTKKVISNRKDELERIVAHFCIQIDNPVVLLNQEISRNFLNSKLPKAKYDFFMKATNLYTLKKQLLQTKEDLRKAEETKQQKEKVLPEVEHEVKELSIKVKKLKSVSKWKQDIELAKNQLVWSEVAAKEKVLETKQKLLKGEEEKLKELLERIQEHEKEKDHLQDKLKNAEKEIKDNEKKSTEITQKIRTLNEQSTGIKREKDQKVQEIRGQQRKMKEIEDEINDYNKAIKEELQKRVGHEKLEEEKKRRQEQQTRLENRLKEIEEQMKEDLESCLEKKKKANDIKSELDSLKSEYTQLQKSNREMQRIIQDMEGSRGDNLAIFGQIYPRINQRIDAADREGRFKEKPVGPLGQYIKLMDTKCSNALQSCLKGLLRAYACDNFDDANVLTDIINQCLSPGQRPPQIITRKFQSYRFDIEENKVKDDTYKSFVDLIKVTDNNAFNVLIDRARLETVAYIPRNQEAMDVLLDIHSVPRNCLMAYSDDGTQFYPTTRDKTFRMYPNDYSFGVNLFSRDFSKDLKEHKDNIRKNEESLQELEVEMKKLQASLQKYTRDIESKDEPIKVLRQERTNSSRKLDELKSFVEPEPIQVTSLEEEKNELVEKLELEQQTLDTMKDELKEIEGRLKDVAKQVSDLEEEKGGIAAEVKHFEKEKNRMTDQLRQLDSSRDSRKKDAQVERVNEMKKAVEGCQEEVDSLTEKAIQQSNGERIECEKSTEQLKAEIQQKVMLIQESEKEVGNADEINAQYEHAKQRLQSVLNTLEHVDSSIEVFEESFKKRRDLYAKRRAIVTRVMQDTFKRVLNNLNFDGEIIINHRGSKTVNGQLISCPPTLELKVNPRGATDNLYRDTRSLSGGERSYTTVAFLIALWEGCNSPFKILDEVDVFMDQLTRQVALDVLVDKAIEHKRQHIFLSPLQMTEDMLKKNVGRVQVFQMPEPVRVASDQRAEQENQPPEDDANTSMQEEDEQYYEETDSD